MVEWESIEIFKMNCNCKLLLMSPKYIIFIFALKKDTWNANDNYTKKKWVLYTFRENKAIHTFILRKEEINYLIPLFKWANESSTAV